MTDRKLLEDVRDALMPFADARQNSGSELRVESFDAAATTLARVEAALAEGEPLTFDCLRLLPGNVMDDATYQDVEAALDKLEAPCQAPDGRWLKLHERVAAIAAMGE